MTRKKGQAPLDIIAVVRLIHLTQPTSTAALARRMEAPLGQVWYTVNKAARQGYIMRLPNDTRWWVRRVG